MLQPAITQDEKCGNRILREGWGEQSEPPRGEHRGPLGRGPDFWGSLTALPMHMDLYPLGGAQPNSWLPLRHHPLNRPQVGHRCCSLTPWSQGLESRPGESEAK